MYNDCGYGCRILTNLRHILYLVTPVFPYKYIQSHMKITVYTYIVRSGLVTDSYSLEYYFMREECKNGLSVRLYKGSG